MVKSELNNTKDMEIVKDPFLSAKTKISKAAKMITAVIVAKKIIDVVKSRKYTV